MGKVVGKLRATAGCCTAQGAASRSMRKCPARQPRKLSVLFQRRYTYCHILHSLQQSPLFFFFSNCLKPARPVAAVLHSRESSTNRNFWRGFLRPTPSHPPPDGGQSRARGHLQSEAAAPRENIKDLTGLDGGRTEGVGGRRWNEKVGSHLFAFWR